MSIPNFILLKNKLNKKREPHADGARGVTETRSQKRDEMNSGLGIISATTKPKTIAIARSKMNRMAPDRLLNHGLLGTELVGIAFG